MRIGVFGGSFDPVHYGHLLLAERAREAHGLDDIWFVPAAVAPHKQVQQAASGLHRAAMLELAVRDNRAFRVSPLELDRGGVSYTADTLAQIQASNADAELFLILGADSLVDLPTWRAPERICELADIVVARRPGIAEPEFNALRGIASDVRIDRFRALQVAMPLIELSSSEIRRLLAAGQSVRYQTPDVVIEYIVQHGLYDLQHPNFGGAN